MVSKRAPQVQQLHMLDPPILTRNRSQSLISITAIPGNYGESIMAVFSIYIGTRSVEADVFCMEVLMMRNITKHSEHILLALPGTDSAGTARIRKKTSRRTLSERTWKPNDIPPLPSELENIKTADTSPDLIWTRNIKHAE